MSDHMRVCKKYFSALTLANLLKLLHAAYTGTIARQVHTINVFLLTSGKLLLVTARYAKLSTTLISSRCVAQSSEVLASLHVHICSISLYCYFCLVCFFRKPHWRNVMCCGYLYTPVFKAVSMCRASDEKRIVDQSRSYLKKAHRNSNTICRELCFLLTRVCICI